MTTEEAEEYRTGDELWKYWRDVEQSDGFDITDVSIPSCMTGRTFGLMPYDCQRCRYPYRILVHLYAKMGLHRYNMLKGTSFEFATLMKFNMSPSVSSSYYITLLAHNPDPAASSLQKTFQVRVDEHQYGTLGLTVSIARPKDEVTTTETPFIPHFHGGAAADGIFKGELPDWPSDDALNDGQRFYVVKESEWKATDWIRTYLELVVCANDRSITDSYQKIPVLPQLEIVKVVIETSNEDVEPTNERLKAKNANVYLIFKCLAVARAHRRVFEIGEQVERKAIIRRVIDETGYLTLTGKLCGGQHIKKPSLALERCKKRARVD